MNGPDKQRTTHLSVAALIESWVKGLPRYPLAKGDHEMMPIPSNCPSLPIQQSIPNELGSSEATHLAQGQRLAFFFPIDSRILGLMRDKTSLPVGFGPVLHHM
jgi:hypothetical protein